MDSNAPNIDDLLRLAREDLARSALSSAEKNLEQAILLNNQVADAFHLLGYVYSKRGKFKKAILAFERVLNIDPFHTEAAIALSSLYNDMGRYDRGSQVFTKAKKRLEKTAPGFDPRINKKLAERHHELGLLYMRFERFQEAHHEFAKAVHLNPDEPSSVIQMAKCSLKSGNKQAAEDLLRKCLESAPKNIEARIQLGVVFHSQQRVKDAHREWQQAVTLDPDNRSAQMYLSMVDTEPA